MLESAFHELPKVQMKKKMWYFDARLKQLRNVENPHDYHDLSHDEADTMGVILSLTDERPLQIADEDAEMFGPTLWEQSNRDSPT